MLPTAEPTPAFSRGTLAMMDSVAGGMTFAMATPLRKNSPATTQIGVVAVTDPNPTRTAASSPSPTVLTAFGPNLRTSAALRGAKIICATANGVISSPADSGVYPRTSCR